MTDHVIVAERRATNRASVAVASLSVLLLTACTTTQKASIDQTSLHCGLLADECGKLTPGEKDQASLRYFNPSAQWTRYNKILIDPVTFWGGNSTSVSAADQQSLVNYFSQQLKEQLGKKFPIVEQPGPGVMKITVAMTDAETATPVLRSISMISPQAHMLSNLKYLATGTFPFVGGAQGEAKITDSVSGELLTAAADNRIGGGNFTTGFQWQWGDAENAIDKWCEMLAERLSSWTSGTATP
ncbi:DUF3313 domain-containing protein [Methylosarcina fibrata]|uniref:DUF3313 domain-containing protein n=1 Tax=Methylosarcina fibrata TaxID=105972 RepID=UPI0003769286|nr:DUF3313 domain-containing protein [Methylosarcina fibrata]